MDFNQKQHRVFYGWWIIGACILISVCTGGLIHYGFTAMLEPIVNEFGWSYAQISVAASIRGLETGLLAPLIGVLVDRWGPRKLMFSGAIVLGLALILLGRVTSLFTFYGVFILIAMATSTSSHTVTMTAVTNWFKKRRSFALGILASGFGLGGLLVPVAVRLIDMFGWRAAMLIFGIAIWVIVLPLSLLVRHKPEQYGYLPDGESNSSAPVFEGPVSAHSVKADIGARDILTSRSFWHIGLAFMLQSLFINSVSTHVIPYLSSIGITRSVSGFMAGAIPLASICGRLAFGWLGDRMDVRRLAATGFALTSLGLLFFACAANGRTWLLIPFLILFCIGWGGNTVLRASLVTERFGTKRFGTVFGFLTAVVHFGGVAGPPLAGWVFDRWSSYQGIWFAFAGLAVVALIIILTTPRFKKEIDVANIPGAL
ncbi:MFS transporter [Chloroflexota bacterium]